VGVVVEVDCWLARSGCAGSSESGRGVRRRRRRDAEWKSFVSIVQQVLTECKEVVQQWNTV